MAEKMEVSAVEDKQKDIAKHEELLLEGQKKLGEQDIELAVDLLSEAARLIESIHGAFAPEAFTTYLEYGKALVSLASGEVQKNRTMGEVETDVEEPKILETVAEETGETLDKISEADMSASKDATADETGNDTTMNETNEADVTLKPEEDEELEGIDLTLSDAWHILEMAKQTCEKQLEAVKEEEDVRKWKLNMSEPLHFLGHVLVLNGKPEEAKVEFIASLDIKQQFLDADDRSLAAAFLEIGDAFAEMCKFADAKHYLEKTLDTLNKKIASLEAAEDKSTEIEELQGLCKEVQEKINEVAESEKSVANLRSNIQEVLKSLEPVDTSSFNDVSSLVKRRPVDSKVTPVAPIEKPDDVTSSLKRPLVDTADSDEVAAKKAKPE